MLFISKIIFRNIIYRRYSAFLSILLIMFSTAVVLISHQIGRESEKHLFEHAKGLHFVVGAKGSPLQLILATVFHFDSPPGNISFRKADSVAQSPFVETAIPISLGDNYQGFRIVGTDSNFVKFYGLTLEEGKLFSEEMHVVLGYEAAKTTGLTIGSKFSGLHGLSPENDEHGHKFIVRGILSKKNAVLDRLILTPLESYWHVHAHHEEEHAGESVENKEITALLVRAKGTTGALMMPNMINKNTELLAASPAAEVLKLKTLISGGIDLLYYFSLCIVFTAFVSILFSFLANFSERKFDLALLRINGARKREIAFIVVGEAFLVSFAGVLAGAVSHLAILFFAKNYLQTHFQMSPEFFQYDENDFIFSFILIIIAVLASLLPAIAAAQADLTRILKKN